MAMLAEPRRKKAWILNPRKSQWAEDESKYGQKMLEQMGWSKGKGLGREMAGITEHIRPSVQNDSRGLGYEGRTDDWVAHLDDFNDLLANLQQGQKETDKGDAAAADVKSLEERSKKSRARVHYHKFTRGKDLSRYSRRDLASILGGRSEGVTASVPVTPVGSRPPSPPAQADSEPASEAETGPPPAPRAEIDTTSGYTTINTGMSVKDYFAAKMRKMKMMKIKNEREQDTTSVDEKGYIGETEGAALESSETIDSEERSITKSKKKKKKRGADSCVDEVLPSSVHEEENARGEPNEKKKVPLSPVNEAMSTVPKQENIGSVEPKKKKKKKRKHDSPVEEVLLSVPEEERITAEEPSKKKRKKRKNPESCRDEVTDHVSERLGVAETEVCSASDSVTVSDLAPETADAPSKKKKRKKGKSKRSGDGD